MQSHMERGGQAARNQQRCNLGVGCDARGPMQQLHKHSPCRCPLALRPWLPTRCRCPAIPVAAAAATAAGPAAAGKPLPLPRRQATPQQPPPPRLPRLPEGAACCLARCGVRWRGVLTMPRGQRTAQPRWLHAAATDGLPTALLLPLPVGAARHRRCCEFGGVPRCYCCICCWHGLRSGLLVCACLLARGLRAVAGAPARRRLAALAAVATLLPLLPLPCCCLRRAAPAACWRWVPTAGEPCCRARAPAWWGGAAGLTGSGHMLSPLYCEL